MKSFDVMTGWKFGDKDPVAEPLYVTQDGRILRFALHAGQTVREHEAPHSPVYLQVLQGSGMFAGADGREHKASAGALLVFDAGETHTIRALNEDLVFLAYLHGAPGAQARS